MSEIDPKVPPRKRTRVLLVDDHPLVRERLAEIITREPDLECVGEAEDRMQAVAAIETLAPDLAIVDITLKNSDGLDLIKDIHYRWPHIAVLVVSMHAAEAYAERALRAGARGFITKQEASRDILVAIRRVLQGTVYLNERIAAQIIGRMASPDDEASTDRDPGQVLADRELQVLELTGMGLNNRQIAQRLHIGVKTVETYRARIREKLDITDPADLLQRAIAWVHRR